MKPLFLKTYGKQRRQLSAWISPDNRRRAFDSTRSTDGDDSVVESPKPTRRRRKRTSVASHRVVRPARRKRAVLHLTENSYEQKNIGNVENVINPPSPPAQQSDTKRRKKTDRAVRPAKRKKVSCLTNSSSDEENICKSHPTHPQPVQQSEITSFNRNYQLVSEPGVLMRHKPQRDPTTSYSEKDSMSASQSSIKSVQMKRHSIVHPPSIDHFVTRRRCAGTTKHRLPKERVCILNSSDEFSSGGVSSNRIPQPFRRRRGPPISILSSAEKLVNIAGTRSFAAKPLREISLNESSDHSLEYCSGKLIFCSTPSAGFLRKHPDLKPFPVNDTSSMPLSMSVSCIDNLSPFQKDVDSTGPIGSPRSVPLTGLLCNENHHLGLRKKEMVHVEPSGDLFLSKNANTSEDTGNHSEDPKTKSSEELPHLNLHSTESESSSYFVSTAGALEWLIEALKEKCLTEHCTVQLKRLDILTLTQLCSQTTYSSCLADEYFVQTQQTNERPVPVDSRQTVDLLQSSQASANLCLSMTDNKNSHYLVSVNSLDSSERAASPTNSQDSNLPFSSTREFVQQSASVFYDDSIHHTNGSTEFIRSAQLPTSNSLQTENMEATENCPIKKCTVQVKKLPLSQLNVEHLKRFKQPNEFHLRCNDRTINLNAKKAENGHTHINATHINAPSDLVSVNLFDSDHPETSLVYTNILQEKCLSNKLTADVKTENVSELKDILNLKDRKLKLSLVTSDSVWDDQSESDAKHCNEDTLNANMKQSGSTRSKDTISSEIENIVNGSCDVLSTRKKMSLAHKDRKRRSTSADRPGTTRKACVSGLSVNRWKNKGSVNTHMFRSQAAQLGNAKAVDCSINELRSMRANQHKQQRELGPAMNFSTPVRASPLNLSSLLADFTPNTYTWSRLKAALSIHRKGMVLLTPRTRAVSGTPGCAHLADVSQDLFATPLRTPLPKRLQSQLHGNNSLVECEDLSDAEKVYAECGQQRPLPWEECILSPRMKRCVKIGEGTFGEVFSTTNASGDTVALKIIPVEGSEKVNGEDQKNFGEILHEIIISKELSSLKEKKHNQTHCFIGLNDLHCVQGCYPPDFLNAWDRFDQQKGSENDRPDFFQKDQIFIILEFEFGGIDLENSNGTLASLRVAKSILHQVTAALAVAEQELNFEHRDLHWGNVLVKTTKQKMGSFLLNGMTHSLETKGVLVRIIDYSLSRLEIDELTVSCDISNDEELFMGQGDYQFEIYRLMRKENGNNWSDYHPRTNVFWLHYLCSKLLSMRYRSTGGRGAKEIREELTRFYDSILQCRSATEALQNCPMFQ